MTVALNPPWPSDARTLQIEDLRVDLSLRRIESAQEQELPYRVFDLLLLLMAEPNRLHTRAELFERLWPRLVVADVNLSQSVSLLRKALGDSRKHWIRTVAKGGYIFEPPAPLQWFADAPAQAQSQQTSTAGMPKAVEPIAKPIDLPAATPSPGDAIDANLAPTTSAVSPKRVFRLSSWRIWIATASVCVVLLITVVVTLSQRRDIQSTSPPTQKLTVALMPVQDAGTAEHWPARLLYEWLKWKLGSLPEVTLLSEADLAAGVGMPPQVVFLTSKEAPEAPGKIIVMARFQPAGNEQRIEMQGTPEQMPAMADALSQRVVQRLLPRRKDAWPKLELSANAARQYADAAQAFERRDWMAAAVAGRQVAQLAPRFGLVRLQLAQSLSQLSQVNAALEEMDDARDRLQPAPPEARSLLEAQRLGIDPQRRQQATDAYAELAKRNPDNIDYAVEHAKLLARSGKPSEALAILQSNRLKPQSIGTRIARLLGLALTYQELGDPARMGEHAKAAERLARNAGKGWNSELAEALRMQGFAKLHQGETATAISMFEQAAATLEQVGNKTGQLHAQSMAQMFAAPGKAKDAQHTALVPQPNAYGDRGLEYDHQMQND